MTNRPDEFCVTQEDGTCIGRGCMHDTRDIGVYVLRLEIRLDPRESKDDAEARQAAYTQLAELGFYRQGQVSDSLTVKIDLQKRHSSKPPRHVKLRT